MTFTVSTAASSRSVNSSDVCDWVDCFNRFLKSCGYKERVKIYLPSPNISYKYRAYEAKSNMFLGVFYGAEEEIKKKLKSTHGDIKIEKVE